MKKQDIIKELNKPFQCKKNCGKCCSLVPFTKAEKDALSLELQEKYAWELFGNGCKISNPIKEKDFLKLV